MYKFETLEKTKCIKCDNFLSGIEEGLKTEKGYIWDWASETVNLGCSKCGLFYLPCPKCMDAYEYEYEPDLGPIYLLQFVGLDCLSNKISNTSLCYTPNKPELHPSLLTASNMCSSQGNHDVMSYKEYGETHSDSIKYLPQHYLESFTQTTLGTDTVMNHWVGDQNLFYIDIEKYRMPTGNDGGEDHHWYCTNCKTNFSFSDK